MSPTVLGFTLGITAAGPISGGIFAGIQSAAAAHVAGAGLVAGSPAAIVQSIAMTSVGWPVIVVDGGIGLGLYYVPYRSIARSTHSAIRSKFMHELPQLEHVSA
jgi:ABC-type sugar transport system substrate-binding protein